MRAVPDCGERALLKSALNPLATTEESVLKTTVMNLEEDWKVLRLPLHTIPRDGAPTYEPS